MDQKPLSGIRLLLVEDDASSRLYMNKILERAGASVLNAGDGMEAIRIAQENPDIKIILMDIQLPLLDGYAATMKIREFMKDVVVIAQTAYGIQGEQDELLASTFDDYILKPILPQLLVEKISSYLPGK